MRELLSQKNSHDTNKEKLNSKSDSQSRSQCRNAREVQRKKMTANVHAQEAEQQRETEVLIERMRDQASNGNIPQYGQTIIDVLMNYQGMEQTDIYIYIYGDF